MEGRYDCRLENMDPESRSNFGIGIESIVGRDHVILLESHFNSTSSLIIPVGRKLGVLKVGSDGSQSMQFFPLTYNVMEITALTISSDRKYVAVCVRLDDGRAQTIVHRLRDFQNRKAPFKTLEREKVSLSLTYICAAFSGDSKQLILSCSNSIEVWKWEQEKVQYAASIQNSQPSRVLCAPFSSIQSPLFTTSGKGHMRMWTAFAGDRFCNKTLMSRMSDEKFIDVCDHIWLRSQDNSTETGRLVAVSRGQQDNEYIAITFHFTRNVDKFVVKQHARTAIDTNLVRGKTLINCISPFFDGFLVSGSLGFIASFQPKKDDNSKFIQLNAIQTNQEDIFSCASCAVDNNQIILYSDKSKRMYSCFQSPQLEREQLIEIFPNQFHSESIIDCDVLEPQRLCITASKDNCVKIWQEVFHFNLLFYRRFSI